MNLSVKTCLLLLGILLHGCASHKKVDRLARMMTCDQTFYLVLDERSRFVPIEVEGEENAVPLGRVQIDYHKLFERAIKELNSNTKAKLVYTDALGLPGPSISNVTVRIEKIVWNITPVYALMVTELEYRMDSKKFYISGENKAHMVANPKHNIFKSLKDNAYNFLSGVCEPIDEF